MQAEADADLDARWRRYERVRDREDREESKYTRYCLEQCDLLGALAELEAKERAMYELENGKDQCMTSLKLALANLGMWARDAVFSRDVCPCDVAPTGAILSRTRTGDRGAAGGPGRAATIQ